jgi:hypothetical protein
MGQVLCYWSSRYEEARSRPKQRWSVGLELRDQSDRVRLAVMLRSNGEPVLQFFNEDGKVAHGFTSAIK